MPQPAKNSRRYRHHHGEAQRLLQEGLTAQPRWLLEKLTLSTFAPQLAPRTSRCPEYFSTPGTTLMPSSTETPQVHRPGEDSPFLQGAKDDSPADSRSSIYPEEEATEGVTINTRKEPESTLHRGP